MESMGPRVRTHPSRGGRRAWPRLQALVAAGLTSAVLLSGCGAAPASSAGKTTAAKGAAGAAAKMPTSTSLKGWKTGVGGKGSGPSIDPTGSPSHGPALQLPGDQSYAWADTGKAMSTFSYDMKTQGLADFFFSSSSTGKGYLFRIDTRGKPNYSGFARTYAWTAWDAPGAGSTKVPKDTWVHVVLNITKSDAVANLTWQGGKLTLKLNGQKDIVYPPQGNAPPTGKTMALAYKPQGNAFGFQGDALGPTSYTWVANFK